MNSRGAERACSRLALAGALAFLTFAPVRAAEPQIHYTRHSAVNIPFNIDPNEKRIQQVLLYVSEDFGKSFSQVAAVTAAERNFKFNARKDGWYWFATQTQDNQGQLNPPALQQLQAGLKICLDTVPPQVTVRGIQLRDYPFAVEWDVRDENPDVMSLRLDYRSAGAPTWTPLSPPQLLQGQFGWNPSVPGPLEVRLQVKDKAGNQTEQIATVVAGQANPGGVGPGPGPAAPPSGTAPPQNPSNVIYVNKRRVALNYKIENVGKSDVKEVEVWCTEDGRSWSKYSVAPRNGPFPIELSQERRYGFTLVAVSGVGLADRRPMAGDAPQVWVEVDLTRPLVQLLGVEVGRGQNSGKMTIRWIASDKHLEALPIAISYAENRQGPWKEIEKTLPNDGRYVWQMPADGLPFTMFIKVEAKDRAGNVGIAATQSAIAVDLQVPKATVIGVEPVTPGSPGPPGPP